ncbi:MAG: flagellar hook protein FlgE [Pseudomonadota bacterium]
MGFQQGLSGLNAAAKNLDVIGNNISNAGAVGFKGAATHFADVFASSASAGGINVGTGVSVSAVDQTFSQGNITTTNNPLDIAINGKGFFRLSNESGLVTYGRNGQFQLDKNGYIVNDTGAKLTGYLAGAGGTLITAAPVDLQISTAEIAPQTTSTVTALLNLDSRSSTLTSSAFDLTDPTTYTSATSVAVFDSLGNSHPMSVYFVKTGGGTWDVYGALDGTQIGTTALGTVGFTGAGAIDTTATTLPFSVSAAVTSGATTPLAYTLDFTGTTQFGSDFGVSQVTQDGFTSGRLAGYTISSDGIIQGRYSNGQTKTLAQVALADFTNPQGLQPQANSVWTETAQSGTALVGTPNSGNLGALQSGAVEESNVDLTAELVNLIAAQRAYQANAQTIKTQDTVLQTVVNLG